MVRKICGLVLFLFCSVSYGQELPPIPMSMASNMPTDPELSGLVWHPTKTDNFIICSINQEQGKHYGSIIEAMKTDTLACWGLSDINYTVPCKFVIVPNKSLLKKLFGLANNYAEIQRDTEGKIKQIAIWISFDEPKDLVKSYLTLVTLKEYEQVNNLKLGTWFLRGAVILSFRPVEIKNKIAATKPDPVMISNIFSLDDDTWKKMDDASKESFDCHAVYACLLLRKEFGQYNLHKFLQNYSDQNLHQVYGFDKEEFSSTLKRYINNLSNDLNNNKTPDHYLTIYPARN